MIFLTVKEIVLLHDRVVNETGGSLGIREPGLLSAIAEKPQASFGGKELYPTVFDKSAAIFEALCNYHVFIDGNKRTAITILEYFLYRNGLVLDADKDQKEKFTLNTAANNPDLADVARWIKKHSKKAKK